MLFQTKIYILVALLSILMSSTEAVNILLVHGAIADGSSWSDVIPILQADGHNVTAVQQPLTSLPDDIAKTKVALASLPAPVIIVGHSFGGVVITNAAYNATNVAGLVYVAAFGPDLGESVVDLSKNFTALPSNQLFVPDSAGRVTLSESNLETKTILVCCCW